MNSDKQTITKKTLLFFILSLVFLNLFSLNFNASVNRFLNSKGQTNFEINYKVFNDQLTFAKTDKGYIATIDVKIRLLSGDQEKLAKEFTQYAGAKTEASARSSVFYTIDKISITLNRDDLVAELTVTDRNSKTSSTQSIPLKTLDKTTFCSDLEISHNIIADTTSYLDKFHRGDILFYVDPIPVFNSTEDSLFIYNEVYNISLSADSLYHYTEEVKISKGDSIYYQDTNLNMSKSMPFKGYKIIPIKNLNDGAFNIIYTITDLKTKQTNQANNFISVSKVYTPIKRLFPDDENEYKLIDYFLTAKEKKLWRKLDEDGKRNFVDRFWKQKDPSPQTEENEFLMDIQSRIKYADWHWSHYDKGWTSDLGRVYVKNGTPDQIIEKTTEVSAKFGKKEYKIWKYNFGSRVYIFIDLYDSGRFRLIYSQNDDYEKTDPNWKKYLGSDWDSSETENNELMDNSWLKDSNNKTE